MSHDQYDGAWVDDKRQGQGRCLFSNSDLYDGEWHSDLRAGYGICTYACGDRYEGNWHADVRAGKGSQTYDNGETYAGDWYQDVRNGLGNAFRIAPNRGTYEGEWVDNVMSGRGTFIYENGDKYIGELADDVRSGEGSLVTAVGGTYAGGWKDDLRHGFGTESWPNGDAYAGEWAYGQRCGTGEMKYSNGDVFDGVWVDDQRVEGHCVYANGDDFEGTFSADQRAGVGRCVFANGDEYNGEWSGDLQDGEGSCKYANGAVYTGLWQEGLRHGEGEILHSNYSEAFLARDIYRGGWKKDKMSGMGTYIEANGNRYDGIWANGQRQGRGTARYVEEGERYVGIWMRNLRHGRGRHYYGDGTVYDGQWRNGCRDGNGKCTYTASSDNTAGVYTGQWRKDKKQGRGKFVFDNGDEYEGQWKNDLRQGQGICRYHSGEVYDGEWREDVRQGTGGERGVLSDLPTNSLSQSLRILVEPGRPRAPYTGKFNAWVDRVPDVLASSPGAKLPELLGRVLDPKGNPIPGVAITLRPSANSSYRQTASLGDGKFNIPGLPAGGVRISLDFKKDKYAVLCQGFTTMPSSADENFMDVTLAPVTMSCRFNTAAGATLEDWKLNEPKITIPADAFCFENGQSYNGQAEVLALTIDATMPKSLRAMPGFEGNDLAGRRGLMRSYGAIYVEVQTVPGGKSLRLRPGKMIELGLTSKVPLPEKGSGSPSAWRFDEQSGLWQQKRNAVTIDGTRLATPTDGESASTAPIFSEGSSGRPAQKTRKIAAWAGDTVELLSTEMRKRVTEVPVDRGEGEEEGAEDSEATRTETRVTLEPVEKHQFEPVSAYPAPATVYAFAAEAETVATAGGNVKTAASKLLAAQGPDANDQRQHAVEARLVQHLVLQHPGCSHAMLSAGEIMEALQACHGDVEAAAAMSCANPLITGRSMQEKIKEAVAKQFCFAFPGLDEIKTELRHANGDYDTALQSVLGTWAVREVAYERAVEVLSVSGVWRPSPQICAALQAAGFDADAALPALSGIPDILTRCYPVAKVKQLLSDQIKYTVFSDSAIEETLADNGGSIAATVQAMAAELKPQQQMLTAKAQLLDSHPWANMPTLELKRFLLEASQEEPPCTLSQGIAKLVDYWGEREPSFRELDSVMGATTELNATDAELCKALVDAAFDVSKAAAVLSGLDDIMAKYQKQMVRRKMEEQFNYVPMSVNDSEIAEALENAGGDVAVAAESLAGAVEDGRSDQEKEWWMQEYKGSNAVAGDSVTGWRGTMLIDQTGWWNLDTPEQASMVVGKLVENGKIKAGAVVRSIGADYAGWGPDGRSRAADGTFSVLARHSSIMKLGITTSSCGKDDDAGISQTFKTNFAGDTTDIGTIDIATLKESVVVAPVFGGKRSVKNDVLAQREAHSMKLESLVTELQQVLATLEMWKPKIQIAATLTKTKYDLARAAELLTAEQGIMGRYSRLKVRKSLQSEFGAELQIEDGAIRTALGSSGSGHDQVALAVAAMRSSIIKRQAEQRRELRLRRLKTTLSQLISNIGGLLLDGNEKLTAKNLSAGELKTLRIASVRSARATEAVQLLEVELYTTLQHNSRLLEGSWAAGTTSSEDAAKFVCSKVTQLMKNYSRLAIMSVGGSEYGRAREWIRKAIFLGGQTSVFVDWAERLRLRAGALTNLAALLAKRQGTTPARAAIPGIEILQAAAQLWAAGSKEGAELAAVSTSIALSMELAADGAHELALSEAMGALDSLYAVAQVADDSAYDLAAIFLPASLNRTTVMACYCAGHARALLGDNWPPEPEPEPEAEDGDVPVPEEPEVDAEPEPVPRTAAEWYQRAATIASVAFGARHSVTATLNGLIENVTGSAPDLPGLFFIAYAEEPEPEQDGEEGEEY
eukprot:SAG22_NODE_15_length_32914_cov_20.713546_10_plen_1879_part_00